MSLVLSINRSKNVSKWFDYENEEGNVVARFKIRGSGYKSYQVALERANNQISSKGFDVETATVKDKLYHELLFDAAACHLIEDWDGLSEVIAIDEQGRPITKDIVFTTENAKSILTDGDIGLILWHFIKENADAIQLECDEERNAILGKSKNSTTGQNTEAIQKQEMKQEGKMQSTSI